MAILLSEAPESLSADALPHKIWKRPELEIVEATGVFAGQRFELIEGELIDKMGKKRRHATAAKATVKALRTFFDDNFIETQVPIDVSPRDLASNEPEPDILVLRRRFDTIVSNPVADDILLVVEVADRSLRQELRVKARLYPRAGIAEYWVLDRVPAAARRAGVINERPTALSPFRSSPPSAAVHPRDGAAVPSAA